MDALHNIPRNYTDSITSYHRLWRIKKDWGLAGNGKQAGVPKSPAGQKRKASTKKVSGDEDGSEEPSPKKKPRNSKAQAAEAIKKEADVEAEEEGEVDDDKTPAGTPEER